eukprot:2372010-Prymnesium_polylepis.1
MPVHCRSAKPGVAPYRPAWHDSGTTAPSAQAWPTVQMLHCSLVARLVTLLYLPALQAQAAGEPRGTLHGAPGA